MIFDPLSGLSARQWVPSGRPQHGEYAPHIEKDLAFVEGDDIIPILIAQANQTLRLTRSLNEYDIEGLRAAAETWTLKEVIGHLLDDERTFAYRCLHIARGDDSALPGFDQDSYQRQARHEERSLRELMREYVFVRSSTVLLCYALRRQDWMRRGCVEENAVSVRGLAFHIAAHELRHVRQLRERYLPSLATAS